MDSSSSKPPGLAESEEDELSSMFASALSGGAAAATAPSSEAVPAEAAAAAPARDPENPWANRPKKPMKILKRPDGLPQFESSKKPAPEKKTLAAQRKKKVVSLAQRPRNAGMKQHMLERAPPSASPQDLEDGAGPSESSARRPAKKSNAARYSDCLRMKGFEISRVLMLQRKITSSETDWYFSKFRSAARRAFFKETQTTSIGGGLDLTSFVENLGDFSLPEVYDTSISKSAFDLPPSSRLDRESNERWFKEHDILGRTEAVNLRRQRRHLEVESSSTSSSFDSAKWKFRAAAYAVYAGLERLRDSQTKVKDLERALESISDPEEGRPVVDRLNDAREKREFAYTDVAKTCGFPKGSAVNESVFLGLLWLRTGRRALDQVFHALPDWFRVSLLETVARSLVYWVCVDADGDPSKDPDAILDAQIARTLDSGFRRLDLVRLSNCLESLVDSQTPETLRLVLATPGGAKVVQSIVMTGQARANKAEDPSRWTQAFGKFVAKAQKGIRLAQERAAAA